MYPLHIRVLVSISIGGMLKPHTCSVGPGTRQFMNNTSPTTSIVPGQGTRTKRAISTSFFGADKLNLSFADADLQHNVGNIPTICEDFSTDVLQIACFDM